MASYTNDDAGVAVPPNSQSVPGPFSVIGDLSVTGAESIGTNLTVVGSATVGSAVVTGNETVGGTLGVAGAITPSQTNGIVGTTAANNANAGAVGEFLSVIVGPGAPVSLTNAAMVNVASIVLTAGDWDCSGTIAYVFAATTSYTALAWGLTVVSGNVSDDSIIGRFGGPATVPNTLITFGVPTVRFSIAAPATIYLIGYAAFTVSTLTAHGAIRCRRVR